MQRGERRRQGLFTSATDAPLPLCLCLGHHCLSTGKVSIPHSHFPFLLATACHCSPCHLHHLAPPSPGATTTMARADKQRHRPVKATLDPGRPRISLGKEHPPWTCAIKQSLSLSLSLCLTVSLSHCLTFVSLTFFQHFWSIRLKAAGACPQHLNEETWEMAWTR